MKTHLGLFEGIGGFSLAAQWAVYKTVAWCEIDKYCQTVLKYHFPNAHGYEDIRTTDFTIYRGQIDLLTGGFPCQPFSLAGKRKGTEDNRFLWPEMLRAIREIKPTWIIAENVYGLVSQEKGLVFKRVQSEMEALGYEVQPFVIPACAVGAPHRRDRVWIIAYSNSAPAINTIQTRRDLLTSKTISNTPSERLEKWQQTRGWENAAENRTRLGYWSERLCSNENAADPERIRQPKSWESERPLYSKTHRKWQASWANDDGNWPTQSPVCRGDDGVSFGLVDITFSKWRNESIKALGNSIVPQCAYEIMQAINEATQ